MALVAVNQPRPRAQESTLDKIAAGVQIANGVLGIGMAIPKFMQESKLNKARIAEANAASEAKAKSLEPPTQSDIQGLQEVGAPKSFVPQTHVEAQDAILRLTETPAQKASREYRDVTLGLLAGKNRREEAKFTREMEQPVLTPAEEAVDKGFAEGYKTFLAEGGFSDAEKGLSQLEEVKKKLLQAPKTGKDYTGNVVGLALKSGVGSVTNPEAQAMKDAVEEVVQRNLRLILGAQFTEREGIRLIERAYNPMLDEAENAKRVDRLMKQMKDAYDAKIGAAKYYEANGTLKGWRGSLVRSAEDFLKDARDPDIQSYADKYNLSYERAKAIIDSRREAHAGQQ